MIYLKACSVLLQNAVAGRKVGSREFKVAVAVTRTGFPRVIPAEHRRYIRNGARGPLRLWLTMFGVYRLIDVPIRVDIDSILLPFGGCERIENEWNQFMERFGKLLRGRSIPARKVIGTYQDMKRKLDPYIGCIYRPLVTSGPNSTQGSVAMCNVEKDGLALFNSELWPVFNDYCTEVDARDLSAVVRTAAKFDPSSLEWPHFVGGGRFGSLGRVAFKKEPGKVRVFAMLDFWSQSGLRGMHEYLLKILGSLNRGDIRIDGTFDQGETVQYLLSKLPTGRKFYSFDLSSATDRFPVWAQESIIKVLFGEKVGSLWRRLLVERGYAYPAVRPGKAAGRFSDRLTVPYGRNAIEVGAQMAPLYYAVGQPMGAHSSWAAFTLAHHALVQFAAWRVGFKGWFEQYGLLGDDLVIFDRDVAAMYLRLSRRLGVQISLAKSLPGVRGTFEFAKRFAARGAEASPLSLKEYSVFNRSLSAMVEMVSRASMTTELRPAAVLRALGYGYKTTGILSSDISLWPVRLRRVVISLLHPSSPLGVKNWEAWIGMKRIHHLDFIPQEAVPRLLEELHKLYREEFDRLVKLFEPIKARLEELGSYYYLMGEVEDFVRSVCVEKPILEAVMKRLEELQVVVLEPQSGSLSDAYKVYRDALDELSAMRPCINMFARAPERDPKYVINELRIWENVRGVVDKTLGGKAGLVCRRKSRKKTSRPSRPRKDAFKTASV